MPGIFGNIGQGARSMFGGLSPYSNTLLMGGLGMLSGNNNQEGFQNAMYGVRAGSEMDQGRRDRKKEATTKACMAYPLVGASLTRAGGIQQAHRIEAHKAGTPWHFSRTRTTS